MRRASERINSECGYRTLLAKLLCYVHACYKTNRARSQRVESGSVDTHLPDVRKPMIERA